MRVFLILLFMMGSLQAWRYDERGFVRYDRSTSDQELLRQVNVVKEYLTQAAQRDLDRGTLVIRGKDIMDGDKILPATIVYPRPDFTLDRASFMWAFIGNFKFLKELIIDGEPVFAENLLRILKDPCPFKVTLYRCDPKIEHTLSKSEPAPVFEAPVVSVPKPSKTEALLSKYRAELESLKTSKGQKRRIAARKRHLNALIHELESK